MEPVVTYPSDRTYHHVRWAKRCRKQIFTALTLLCKVALLSSLPHSVLADDIKLHFATSLYPPITTAAQDGIVDAIVIEAFKRADIEFSYEATSAPRGLYGSVTGEFDGFIGAPRLRSESLSSLVAVPEFLYTGLGGGVFFDANVQINKLDDFRKYNVGYVRGWRYVEGLLGDHPNKFGAATTELLFEMLVKGRIDVAYMRFVQAEYLADNEGISGLRFSKYSVETDLYMHLNPQHANLAPVLAEAILSLKQDGTYLEILAGSRGEGEEE